jgi:hypothetical protein
VTLRIKSASWFPPFGDSPVTRPLLGVLLALLLLPLSAPGSLEAQERGWHLAPFARVGGFIPLRSTGKSVGFFQNTFPQEQQVIARLGDALEYGGGVSVEFPARSLRVDLAWARTDGGDANAQIAFCGSPDDPLSGAPYCGTIYTPYEIQGFSADVVTVRGRPGSLLRPVLSLGVGLRQYSFEDPDCTAYEDSDVASACVYISDLWVDGGGYTPTLRGGLGLDVALGIVSLRGSVNPMYGTYPGGIGNTVGHGQLDISAFFAAAIRVY